MSSSPGHYYVPHDSRWSIVACVGLFLATFGAALWLNQHSAGTWILLVGAAALATMFFGWFRNVIHESEHGLYNDQVDKSFRWGMAWFILSEVMFFAAFFGALFYARTLVIPWLSGEGNNFFTNLLLWGDFENVWPSAGPAAAPGSLEVIPAWGVPAINTAVLLSSGATITVAHHMLVAGRRTALAIWLAATFVLGIVFLVLQANEYIHAYTELNLRLDTGIYGSTFFMLTGFHGLHVTLGTLMLIVIWLRVLKGHFTPTGHFAFEGVAWYWHFVDFVWLGLFVFVYWI